MKEVGDGGVSFLSTARESRCTWHSRPGEDRDAFVRLRNGERKPRFPKRTTEKLTDIVGEQLHNSRIRN